MLTKAGHRGQHLVGACTHANVLSEVDPAYYPCCIYQKLGWPGDILSIWSSTHMQQVVTAYHLGVGIGEEREAVAGLFAQLARHFRRIHADGHGTDTCRFEFNQLFLNASQLEVAEWSPVTAIENQQHGFGGSGFAIFRACQ